MSIFPPAHASTEIPFTYGDSHLPSHYLLISCPFTLFMYPSTLQTHVSSHLPTLLSLFPSFSIHPSTHWSRRLFFHLSPVHSVIHVSIIHTHPSSIYPSVQPITNQICCYLSSIHPPIHQSTSSLIRLFTHHVVILLSI